LSLEQTELVALIFEGSAKLLNKETQEANENTSGHDMRKTARLIRPAIKMPL
jgi:hypothetical protein